MRDITFRTLGATAVLFGIAFAAVAQIGSGEPSAIAIEAPEPTAVESVAADTKAPTTTTVPAPFDYRIGLLADTTTANFWAYYGSDPTAWNAYVLGPTKSALFAFSPGEDVVGELADVDSPPKPRLGDGGWFVRVPLHNVKWSDGAPLTAHDFVFTFETVRSLGLGGGWSSAFPADVTEVLAIDDSEIEIRFSTLPPLRVWPYSVGLAPVMPSHVWSGPVAAAGSAEGLYAQAADSDVSSGPVVITGRSEKYIQAEGNPHFEGDRPDTVEFVVFDSESAAVEALEGGTIDTILSPKGLTAESIASLTSVEGVTATESPAYSVRYLGFNLTREPMNEPAFRKALNLLLDKQQIVTAAAPSASPAFSVLPSANGLWHDAEAVSAIEAAVSGSVEQRLTAAVEALSAAGYAWHQAPAIVDGQIVAGTGLTINGIEPVPLTILTAGDEYDPARPAMASAVEQAVELIGFDARPVVTDFNTVVDLAFSRGDDGARQYDMYISGWTLGSPVYPSFYSAFFSREGAFNSTGYVSDRVDALVSDYLSATSKDRAEGLLWEIESALAEDLPYLTLYHPTIWEAHRSDRVAFATPGSLGGIQAASGGLTGVSQAG